jgi:thymidylate synthase (FAD)
MRVLREPKVTVVGYTTFVGHPDYPIPPDGTDAIRLGAFSAKTCYNSFGTGGRPCVDNQRQVLEHFHGSVLEHAHVSVLIEGITRACSLELNRHRTWGISQLSTRYADDQQTIVLEPYYASLADDDPLLVGHLAATQTALDAYEDEVAQLIARNPFEFSGVVLRKWARGKARNILPHNVETRGVYSTNYRALRHFLELRTEPHAEPEIRRLGGSLYDSVCSLAPQYFEDYTIEVGTHGLRHFIPRYRKV